MASQINDQPNEEGKKQDYAYAFPFITPSGHEFSFYDTPENQRVVLKHTSGSALEFKADGSVVLVTVKDFHVHHSVLSNQTTTPGEGGDQCLALYDTDFDLEVGGKLNIKCAELNIEVGSAAKCVAGTDFVVSGDRVNLKAMESVSLEATKSIYVDAKEYKERVQTHTVNMGSHEDTGTNGGLGVMNVSGDFVIRNNDPNGGITIASAGYTNIVTGAERCDITGRYLPAPGAIEAEQVATWTQKVYTPTAASVLNLSRPGGDYWFQSAMTSSYTYAMTGVTPTAGGSGLMTNVMMGNELHNVLLGNRTRMVGLNESVIVAGVQTVRASKIFLN